VSKQVAALKPGVSTSQDVAQALGAPTEVVQLGHGSAWRYDFTVRKRAAFSLIVLTFLNEDARADRVWLFFNADNQLTHLGSTFEARDAEYAMPWQDVHD
jgi:outer membrane protein assembly factor BamE (lipoprotein component of BamABCDE complex)